MHALCIIGSAHERHAAAREHAHRWRETHDSDDVDLDMLGESFDVTAAREVVRTASLATGARSVLIDLSDASELTQATLLKTLEEPPGDLQIVVCADPAYMPLVTIRSRCRVLRLGPVSAQELSVYARERGLDLDLGTAALLSDRASVDHLAATPALAPALRSRNVAGLLGMARAVDADARGVWIRRTLQVTGRLIPSAAAQCADADAAIAAGARAEVCLASVLLSL